MSPEVHAAAQAFAREQERIARHAAELETIRARLAGLSPHAARCLALQLLTAVLGQAIGLLPGHEEFGQRIAAVVDLVRRLTLAIGGWSGDLAELHADADAMHGRLSQPSRTRDRWALEERLPADLAQMVRRASSPDLGRFLRQPSPSCAPDPLVVLVHDMRAAVAYYGLRWAPCEAAIGEALAGAALDLETMAADIPRPPPPPSPGEQMRAAVARFTAAVPPAIAAEMAVYAEEDAP